MNLKPRIEVIHPEELIMGFEKSWGALNRFFHTHSGKSFFRELYELRIHGFDIMTYQGILTAFFQSHGIYITTTVTNIPKKEGSRKIPLFTCHIETAFERQKARVNKTMPLRYREEALRQIFLASFEILEERLTLLNKKP